MKILFLDADGTLFHHTGYIPTSALKACQKAQENDHKICLCTGRQTIEIFGDLLKIDYDGIIAGSGASILVHGKSIGEFTFTNEEFDRLYNYLESNEIPCCYEGSQGLYGHIRTKKKLDQLLEEQCANLNKEQLEKHGLYKVWHQFEVCDDIKNKGINKVSFLESHKTYKQVVNDLSDLFDIVPATFAPFGKESGEISSKSITKASGMQVLMDYYHIKDEDVIAIGDGYNDLCMFEKAHYSIAMGNAEQAIKEKADFVTSNLEDCGIYNAFKMLDLI